MKITRTAPAKINLTLEVLSRRLDGYHEIRSVMQAISLCDTLTFENASDDTLELKGGTDDAPPDAKNLVLRAARALNAAAGTNHGAKIMLEKRIPVGAGLGGGSSDAATTLMALNELWDLGLSRERLMDIGASLGSDVPFFITSGTALAEGRGEKLTDVRLTPNLWLALAKPHASLSTPAVYQSYRHPETGSSECRDNASDATLGTLRQFNERTQPVHLWTTMRNDLEKPALRLMPDLQTVFDALGRDTMLCGSGSSVFKFFYAEQFAQEAAKRLAAAGFWSVAAHTVQLPYEGAE